jgi:hypothetical protein
MQMFVRFGGAYFLVIAMLKWCAFLVSSTESNPNMKDSRIMGRHCHLFRLVWYVMSDRIPRVIPRANIYNVT